MCETMVAYESFIGVDLHKDTVTLFAVDPRGQVLAKLKIHTKCVGKIEAWLLALPRPSRLRRGILGGMARVSKGHCEKSPWRAIHSRGPMHPWRTLGPAIPRQVASPQSLLPFHQANQAYHTTYNRSKANRKSPLTNGPYRDKAASAETSPPNHLASPRKSRITSARPDRFGLRKRILARLPAGHNCVRPRGRLRQNTAAKPSGSPSTSSRGTTITPPDRRAAGSIR